MSLADCWKFMERCGDWFNPILVKEVRQAFKGKVFVVTFALLLLLAWCISILGVLVVGNRIHNEPTPWLTLFYFGALQAAVLVVVPFVGFRSMQAEFDGETWELLCITQLTPRQIVMGKLTTMHALCVVFGSIFVPCLSFCSLLPGFDWQQFGLIMALTGLQSFYLCSLAVAIASLARKRHWQMIGMLCMLLMAGWYGCWAFATSADILNVEFDVTSLWYAMSSGTSYRHHSGYHIPMREIWSVVLAEGFVVLPLSYLLSEVAVSQVTFEADSRSGRIRMTCTLLFIEQLGWVLWQEFESRSSYVQYASNAPWMAMTWGLFLITACLEPETISTRIRRKTTWRSRLISPFMPGGSRALVYLLLHMAVVPLIFVLMESCYGQLREGRQLALWAAYIACYATLSVAASRALLAVRPQCSRTWIRVGVVIAIVASFLPGFVVMSTFRDQMVLLFPLILLNPFEYCNLCQESIEWVAISPVLLVALIGVHLNWHIIKRSVLDVGPVAPESLQSDSTVVA